MAILTVSGYCVTKARYNESGKFILECVVADKVWDYKDKEEKTNWIRAVWFGERAEKLANSLVKAKMVTITGREDFKIYNGKIVRDLEPFDHRILLFQQESESSNTQESGAPDYGDPPPPDNGYPFL